MKAKHRNKIIGLGILSCVVIFIFLTRNFWRNELIAYRLGKVEFAAQLYQDLPKDIDTVEIFILSNSQNANYSNGFFGDYDEPIGTTDQKTLVAGEAKEIVHLWSGFFVGRQLNALCFEPIYGLKFKRKGHIYFQTSVCWECSAYTLPVSFFGKVHIVQYGFDSKSKGAQKLLNTLEKYIPLPPKPTDTHQNSGILQRTNN